MKRKITGFILAIVMYGLCLAPQQASAITTKQINALEAKIENDYNIKVTVSGELVKDKEYAMESLRLLKEAMDMLPDGLVQSLVKHYKSKGKSTEVMLAISSSADMTSPASYRYSTNTISLLVPGDFAFGGTGTSPDAIIHEFGHMLQYAIGDDYGNSKLKSEWTSLNGKKKYDNWDTGYNQYFVSDYAASSYEEDFAETFMAAIYDTETIREDIAETKESPIGKKCDLISKLTKSQLDYSKDLWMTNPQEASEKVMKVLQAAAEKGYIDFTSETAYQYKLTKVEYAELLEYAWRDPEERGYSYSNPITFNYLDTSNDSVNTLLEAGIFTKGSSGLFKPKEYITRKEVAITLARALKLKGVTTSSKQNIVFTDCTELSSAARNCINQVVNAGLMKQKKAGSFAPDKYCTYQEVYMILDQLDELLYKDVIEVGE